MPAHTTLFTFPPSLKITSEMAFELNKSFNFEQYKTIAARLGAKEIDEKLLNSLLKKIKTEQISDDASDLDRALYCIVNAILEDEGLSQLFQFSKLGQESDYKGCGYDDHYLFEFRDVDKQVKSITKEIKKLVSSLEVLGKKVTITIE